jgi:molybdate transport system substrate-binding protein
MSRLKILAPPVLVAALLLPAGGSASSNATKITVLAAASLTQTFPKIDKNPRYSFAGSDQLAFQIQQGAPADVYAAASPKYTQLLYHNGFLRKPTVFATNKLIILVPRSNPARIRSVYDLRRSGIKVVIGDRTVPIGSYTRQILDTLGITSDVMKNVVSQATDVKAIVSQVALGQADAGFVYITDQKPVASRTRKISLPGWAQPSIRYEIGVVKASGNQKAARAFIAKVLSKHGRTLLKKAGFGLPAKPKAKPKPKKKS